MYLYTKVEMMIKVMRKMRTLMMVMMVMTMTMMMTMMVMTMMNDDDGDERQCLATAESAPLERSVGSVESK